MNISRRNFSFFLASTVLVSGLSATPGVKAGEMAVIKVYKSPWCGCCGAWVDHIKANGFGVDVTELEDVTPIKKQYGIQPELHSCHTALIDGYVIEGHVPAQDIERLILERPNAKGLAVPGMPVGSPGMESGARKDPFNVVIFDDKGTAVFSRYNEA